jgi:signal transduction histidine kinase
MTEPAVNLRNGALWGVAAFGVCLVLSRGAVAWRGDLTPTPLWLATASTVALALAAPRGMRWWIIAGGGLAGIPAGLWFYDETNTSLALPTIANVVETIIAIYGFEWIVGERRRLALTRQAMAWIAVAVVAAIASSLIATFTDNSSIVNARGEAIPRWIVGDALGLVLLAPLGVAWRAPDIRPPGRFAGHEAVASIVASGALFAVAFSTTRPVVILLVPVVLWLAIRFGPRLAAPVALVVAVAGTWLAEGGSGPFELFGPRPVGEIQFFNASLAIAALVGGAHAVRAWEDQRLLARTLEALPELVTLVDESGRPAAIWGPPELRASVRSIMPDEPSGTGGELDRVTYEPSDAELVAADDGRTLEVRTAPVTSDRRLVRFRDITANLRLSRMEQQLRDDIEAAREATQTELSQELHDGPIQTLSAARLQFELAQRQASPEVSERVGRGINLVGDAVEALRNTIAELTQPRADDGDLRGALQRVADEFFAGAGVSVDIRDRLDTPVTGATADLAFRIAREALVNARLHAGATRVTIDLRRTESALVIDVVDDGSGFDPSNAQRTGHLGMTLMTERAASGGGTLQVLSSEAGGTTVRAILPLDPDERGAVGPIRPDLR